ncbi:MAG TPA: nuclear transport factor 2 family protein [Solirubrobacteraceae bacterium]|jgi:ketosteroid isomerase-like protein|nr:nuclear transport factor 2 family protein [Solirubrobacteraceae bacterium]
MSGARNIDAVRGMFEAYRAGASERALEFMHPEVTYDATVRPDGKVWHGREGVRSAMAEWTDAWEGFELEIEEYLEAGAEHVAVLWRERGRAPASGVETAEAGVSVFTLRDGLIVAIQTGVDREAALRGLGLEP